MWHSSLRFLTGLALTAAAVVASSGDTPTPEGAVPRTPVLVELFTSEGCSSCPLAEQVLARLAQQQPVAGALIVLLAEHVTYWNRLGWRDRFSVAAATARQEAYAGTLGRGQIYTPQAVVDGAAEAVGSDARSVVRLVEEAARRAKGTVRITRLGGARLEVEARWASGVPGEVFVAEVLPLAETQVQSGENAGRLLVHASVAASLTRAGQGTGEFRTEVARPVSPEGPLRLLVFVQERGGGRVLAVGTE